MAITTGFPLEEQIEKVTDSIRRLFSVEGDLDEAVIEEIHANLVQCINEVNQRLRVVDDLMRRGLRQEAVQECDRSPNLLDLVTAIDFPEWEAWANYVSQFGMARQPDLLIQVASELNDAYTKLQSLDSILRTHRRLALARNPLSDRLRVLRLIAERDPENPVWQDDIKAYEQARCAEIERDIKQLTKADDLNRLSRLVEEINEPGWQTPVPPPLQQSATTACDALDRGHALRDLKALATAIDKDFSEFNFDACNRHHDDWSRLAKRAGLTSDDSLSIMVRPAFEWLAEEIEQRNRQDSFDNALLALESALEDESTTVAEIDRCLATAERFDGAIPGRLTRRYHQRRDLALGQQRRKTQALVAVGCVALVLLGLSVFFVIRWQSHVAEIDQLATTLKNAEGAPERSAWEAALSAYDQASEEKDYVRLNAQLISLAGAVRFLVEEDDQRAARFQHEIDEVGQLLANDPDWESIDRAREVLATAADLSRGEEERLRLAESRGQYDRELRRLQGLIEQEFGKLVARLDEALSRVDKMSEQDIRRTLALVRDLEQFPRVTPGVKRSALLDTKKTKLEQREASLRKEAFREGKLASIRNSVGAISRFEPAIREYVASEREGSRAADFRTVLEKDLPLLKVCEEYNRSALAWSRFRMAEGIDTRAAVSLLDTISKKYRGFPRVDELKDLKGYVTAFAEQPKRMAQVKKILRGPVVLLNQIKWVRDGVETTAYYAGDPQEGKDGTGEYIIVQAYQDFRLIDTKRLRVSKKYSPTFGPTPQKLFADKAREYLDKTGRNEVYEVVAARLVSALFKTKGMHPIVRTQLAQDLLAELADCNPVFDKAIEPLHDLVRSEDVAAANWISRSDREADSKARKLEPLVARIQKKNGQPVSAAYVLEQVDKRSKQLRRNTPRLPLVRWVGVLIKGTTSRWTVKGKPLAALKPGAELFLLDAKPSSSYAIKPAATVQRSGFQVNSSVEGLYEGRPVYAIQGLTKI